METRRCVCDCAGFVALAGTHTRDHDHVVYPNYISHPWAEIRMRGMDSVSTSEAIANMNKM